MLWTIILPFKITFCVLLGVVASVTLLAPVFKWKRKMTFLFSAGLACIAFIPSCTGVMAVIDKHRFGIFQYESFEDVNDYKIERYLPSKARDITVEQFYSGHRAKYSISETELIDYVDSLWSARGDRSPVPREKLDDGEIATVDEFNNHFGVLGWPALDEAVKLNSPFGAGYSGATYFLQSETGTAYHRAAYW